MQEISLTALFEQFDASVHWPMLTAIKASHATHVVVFENQAMDSPRLGQRSMLSIGPHCTYGSLEAIRGQHLGDLPSERQYPTAYAVITADYETLAQAAANWEKPGAQPKFERKDISRKPQGVAEVFAEALEKREQLLAFYQNLPQSPNEDRTFESIKRCTLSFDRQKYLALDLTITHNKGTHKEYTERRLVGIGAKPKHKQAKVVYIIADEEHEWFLGSYYDADEPNTYNPVGKTFFLHLWTHKDRIDQYEKTVRPKIPILVSYT